MEQVYNITSRKPFDFTGFCFLMDLFLFCTLMVKKSSVFHFLLLYKLILLIFVGCKHLTNPYDMNGI